MTKLDFMRFLSDCNDPSAIYFELARQEADTNSIYSMAYEKILEITSDSLDTQIFAQVLPEEGKHMLMFIERASELNDMKTAEGYKIEYSKD